MYYTCTYMVTSNLGDSVSINGINLGARVPYSNVTITQNSLHCSHL